MTERHATTTRLSIGLLLLGWLAPAMIVGISGLTDSLIFACVIGLLAAGAAAYWAAGRLTGIVGAVAAQHKTLAALAVIVALAAIVQNGRLAVYEYDEKKPQYSTVPGDNFRVIHNCFTSYSEAVRFAAANETNIYREELYQPRTIGPLRVDTYHYPPTFLVLPELLRIIDSDFFAQRRLWYGLQTVFFTIGVLGLAGWIGGAAGGMAVLVAPFLLAMPHIATTFQTGNFQSTAFPLALLGMCLITSRRIASGSLMLGYAAAGKIFPGLLVLYLIAARRWRAVAAVAAVGIVIALVALFLFGIDSYRMFLTYEVPRISSGVAFPQIDRVNSIHLNGAFYGLLAKLRTQGASFLDPATSLRLTSLYGLLVIALGIVTAVRARHHDASTPRGRLLLVQLWLALVTLASFRSPFAGF
ncbi:MAG TPA: glycosyltransferase family 87 protein, partial [Thermoanaerobaculia bacterium]|nr:glycosyltransferase family 87 protein [Thermoanaerobaculia bacterium]